MNDKRVTEAKRDEIKELKGTLKNFKDQMEQKQAKISDLERIEEIADKKIRALNDIHAEKVRSLMNSIQVLKKENAAINSKSKDSGRTKFIQDLQVEISSQDKVIDILRKVINDDKKADGAVIRELTKGPARVRAQTREELRMEIKDLQKKLTRFEKNKELNGADEQKSFAIDQISARGMQETNAGQTNLQAQSNEEFISKIGELDNKVEDLKLLVSGKQTEIDKYKQLLSQKNTEIMSLGQFKNETKFLTYENDKLKEKIEELRRQMDMHNYPVLTQEIQLKDLEITGTLLQDIKNKNNEAVKNELDTLEQKLRKVQTQMNRLTTENTDLLREKKVLETKLEEAKQRNNRFQADLKDQTSKLEEACKEKTNNLRDANLKKREVETKYDKMVAERQNDELEIKNLTAKMDELEAKIAEQEQKIDALENQKGEVDIENIQHEHHENNFLMQSNIKELEDKRSELEMDMNFIKQENFRLRERVREITQNEIELSDKVDILEQENAFLSRKVIAANLIAKGNFNETLSSEATQSHLKEMTSRYETRIKDMTYKIQELEIRNKELEEIQRIMNGSAGAGSYKSLASLEQSMLSESMH